MDSKHSSPNQMRLISDSIAQTQSNRINTSYQKRIDAEENNKHHPESTPPSLSENDPEVSNVGTGAIILSATFFLLVAVAVLISINTNDQLGIKSSTYRSDDRPRFNPDKELDLEESTVTTTQSIPSEQEAANYISELAKLLQDRFNVRFGNSGIALHPINITLIFSGDGVLTNHFLADTKNIDVVSVIDTIYGEPLPLALENINTVEMILYLPTLIREPVEYDDNDDSVDTEITSRDIENEAIDDDFRLLGNPTIQLDAKGNVTLSVKTNWKPGKPIPMIFFAAQENYLSAGYKYDPEILDNLTATFNDSQREITIRSKNNLPDGRHSIVLEIFPDRDNVVYYPVWFELD